MLLLKACLLQRKSSWALNNPIIVPVDNIIIIIPRIESRHTDQFLNDEMVKDEYNDDYVHHHHHHEVNRSENSKNMILTFDGKM